MSDILAVSLVALIVTVALWRFIRSFGKRTGTTADAVVVGAENASKATIPITVHFTRIVAGVVPET